LPQKEFFFSHKFVFDWKKKFFVLKKIRKTRKRKKETHNQKRPQNLKSKIVFWGYQIGFVLLAMTKEES
jgi:cytochrome b subunit of formate dehydrogenase